MVGGHPACLLSNAPNSVVFSSWAREPKAIVRVNGIADESGKSFGDGFAFGTTQTMSHAFFGHSAGVIKSQRRKGNARSRLHKNVVGWQANLSASTRL